MKALTIKQPWLWCITDHTKRVENRTWKPPYYMVGQRIALHASKARDSAEWDAACDLVKIALPSFDDLPLGAIVATARLVGFVAVKQNRTVEVVYDLEYYQWRDDPWFFPPAVGWLLSDVRKLSQPIPCRGALGLWNVPDEMAKQILEDAR